VSFGAVGHIYFFRCLARARVNIFILFIIYFLYIKGRNLRNVTFDTIDGDL